MLRRLKSKFDINHNGCGNVFSLFLLIVLVVFSFNCYTVMDGEIWIINVKGGEYEKSRHYGSGNNSADAGKCPQLLSQEPGSYHRAYGG